MHFFELVGAILSIVGAVLMSSSTATNDRPLYWAFVAYFASNWFLLLFFWAQGKVPIVVLIVLFILTSTKGILSLSPDKARDAKFIALVYVAFGFYVWAGFEPNGIDYTVLPLDTLASTLAIVGTYLLTIKGGALHLWAYGLFIAGDAIFVGIGLANGYYFFVAQSVMFVATSVRGFGYFYETNKKKGKS